MHQYYCMHIIVEQTGVVMYCQVANKIISKVTILLFSDMLWFCALWIYECIMCKLMPSLLFSDVLWVCALWIYECIMCKLMASMFTHTTFTVPMLLMIPNVV